MTKMIYNGMDHTWCLVKHPAGAEWNSDGWEGPQRIILHVGSQVWIEGSYSQEGHPDIERVRDGKSNGYDEHGSCILSIPAEWVTAYYNDEEAESVMRCIDANERLLGYAR